MRPVRSDADVAARLRNHVHTHGKVTRHEWVTLLKAPLLTKPARTAFQFRSVTYDVRGGKVFVTEALAEVR